MRPPEEVLAKLREAENKIWDDIVFLTENEADRDLVAAVSATGIVVWYGDSLYPMTDGPRDDCPGSSYDHEDGIVQLGGKKVHVVCVEVQGDDDDESVGCHVALPDLEVAPAALREALRPFRTAAVEADLMAEAEELLKAGVPIERLRELIDTVAVRTVINS